MTTTVYHNEQSAWRHGFCDGVQGRECKSPFHDFKRQGAYIAGFQDGQERAQKIELAKIQVTASEEVREWKP